MSFKTVSIKFSGKCRVIVDGDNINAVDKEGSFTGSFERTLELRDLDAPENKGGGRAQPTGPHDGQPGSGD